MKLNLILILSLIRLHQLRGEIQETPGSLANSLNANIPSNPNNEFFLPDFITSINLDYTNNALVVKFRRPVQQGKDNSGGQVLLDKNFMRFGRGAGDSSLMRFGKRQSEFLDVAPVLQEHDNENSARDSRGDNFMRFGKSSDNLMRFGRGLTSSDSSETVIDDTPTHSHPDYIFQSEHLLTEPVMRFARNDGRMRFGRSDSFMRLGRAPIAGKVINSQLKIAENAEPYNSRFGRTDKNFMRFGKLDQNFMRFGKRQKQVNEDHNEPGKSNISKVDYSNHWRASMDN